VSDCSSPLVATQPHSTSINQSNRNRCDHPQGVPLAAAPAPRADRCLPIRGVDRDDGDVDQGVFAAPFDCDQVVADGVAPQFGHVDEPGRVPWETLSAIGRAAIACCPRISSLRGRHGALSAPHNLACARRKAADARASTSRDAQLVLTGAITKTGRSTTIRVQTRHRPESLTDCIGLLSQIPNLVSGSAPVPLQRTPHGALPRKLQSAQR
jgi:hypothetical protein